MIATHAHKKRLPSSNDTSDDGQNLRLSANERSLFSFARFNRCPYYTYSERSDRSDLTPPVLARARYQRGTRGRLGLERAAGTYDSRNAADFAASLT